MQQFCNFTNNFQSDSLVTKHHHRPYCQRVDYTFSTQLTDRWKWGCGCPKMRSNTQRVIEPWEPEGCASSSLHTDTHIHPPKGERDSQSLIATRASYPQLTLAAWTLAHLALDHRTGNMGGVLSPNHTD